VELGVGALRVPAWIGEAGRRAAFGRCAVTHGTLLIENQLAPADVLPSQMKRQNNCRRKQCQHRETKRH
jgi:hypothetical protein